MDLGVQLFSIKKHFIDNPDTTLDRLADIGYRAVEFPLDLSGENRFGMGDVPAAFLAKKLASRGLKLIATHLRLTDDTQLAAAIDYSLAAGSSNVVIPLGLIDNQEQVLTLADRLNTFGEVFRQNGIQLFYHNHFQEFQRFDGKSAFQTLLERTDPQLVKFEIDTYWAVRGGADIVPLLEQLGPRCGLIHQKDMPAGLANVDILAGQAAPRPIDLSTIRHFTAPHLFTEVGNGVLPIAQIIDCARQHCQPQAIIVELDATDIDELDSVAISYRNLSRLMGVNQGAAQ